MKRRDLSVWGPLAPLMIVSAFLLLSLGCTDKSVDVGVPPTMLVTTASGASLGSVSFPVSCGPEAAVHLRRGLALLHNMTYAQAESEFRSASKQDEDCPLAYWGIAMSYVHPLWPDVPSAEQFDTGLKLLGEARSYGPLSGRDEAYVSALESYYRDWSDRSERDRLSTYFEGWERALVASPADVELQLFRSLLLTAVATTTETRVEMQIEAGEMAEAVLEMIPDHTGALHYIIHAYDLPELADRALPAARIYGDLANGNQHALHMTSHIFTRVGSWGESITYNQQSADVALRNPINGNTSFHYLHALDYLAYAFLQLADDDGAQQVLNDMESIEDPIFDHGASLYALAAVPARIVLERQRWSDAARLASRQPSAVSWDRYPQFEAITEYARGLGAARSGNLDAAAAAVRKLDELQIRAAAAPGAYDWGEQVQIQALTVRAWVAYAEDRVTEAIAIMNEATALESTTRKNPVTPGGVLPAAELLGDMYLGLEKYALALPAYESALKRTPKRLNSLYGAGRAAELAGDTDVARGYYRQLVTDALSKSKHVHVEHAKTFLATD